MNRSEFPYVKPVLLICFKHALHNLHNFRKIEVYVLTQTVDAMRYKPQVRGLNYRCVQWIYLFLPATLLPWIQFNL